MTLKMDIKSKKIKKYISGKGDITCKGPGAGADIF